MSDKKNNWVDIGTLRKKSNGKSQIVLNSNIKILRGVYNPETKTVDSFDELDLGKFRSVVLSDPMPGLEALLAGGYIDEAEFNKRVDFLDEKNVTYKLSVPPLND